ncbi:hypothetical protein PRK78_006743 [Emydomyces testavorans]|uniref:Chromosome condensation protein n=1 Tax=Emydomyces testavorans TaxID=2070801 RepID=A0AAF0DN24_9EURO|nr:hypothetical protein PRK78_006743 [Emydomyces testavorans]
MRIPTNDCKRENMELAESERGPSDQQQRVGHRDSLEEPTPEEIAAVPPTELVFPQIEEQRLDEERERKRRNEAALRRAQEQGEVLSELSIPVPVERRPSRVTERWNSLESAESRVFGRPSSVPSIISAELPLSNFATQLYTISYLIFFSIFGALARIGLEALTYYPGAPVTTSVLWANVGGCLLMGFFAEDRSLFREEWGRPQKMEKEANNNSIELSPAQSHHGQTSPEDELRVHKAVKKTIPLYVGLTTGFCGSFTSFSAFMSDVFLALSNDLPNPNTDSIPSRNGGYSFMAVIAIILYTMALSLSSLAFGAHLAVALDRFTPTLSFLVTRRIVDRSMVILGFGCWVGAVVLAIWPPDRQRETHQNWRGRALFATVFAPLGCLLRYYVSLALNARIPSFPLGTFVANMLGTVVLGMCFDLKHAVKVVAIPTSTTAFGVGRLAGCQVLNGIIDGFCGCITTVSTWVAELYTLELRHAYHYGLLTIGLALSFLVVIMGSMKWTAGFAVTVC